MTDEWNADVVRQSLRGHELPPPGFDFAAASNRDRVRYGFPAEPDRRTQPRLWAKWERNLHRPWRRVVPEYDLQPARRRGLSPANTTSPNYCGAIAPPPAGTPFNIVSATWVVPGAYPAAEFWNGHGYNDGHSTVAHWVGIDGGYSPSAGANDVLQAGTETEVDVVNGIITVTCYAWYEWWYNATHNGSIKLKFPTGEPFIVNPGDVVEVKVCSPFSNTYGVATVGNVTRGEYVTQRIDPPSPTLTLAGDSVEWIVERPVELSTNNYYKFANYAAIFFSDCLAGGPNYEIDLTSAGLSDMTDGSTTLSTALQVSNSVLECYYGTQQP